MRLAQAVADDAAATLVSEANGFSDDRIRSAQAASTARSCGGAAKSLRSGYGVRGRQWRGAAKGKTSTYLWLENGFHQRVYAYDDAKRLVGAGFGGVAL